MTTSPSSTPDAADSGRRLLGPGVLVALGLAVGQVLGYVLAVLGARLLAPAAFGELGTLTNLLVIGAVVPLAVQTVAARRAAAGDTGDDPPTILRLALSTSVIVLLVGVVVVPVATVLLRLSPVAVSMVVLTLVPLTIASSGVGLAQGRHRFAVVAAAYAVIAAGRTGLAVVALVATGSVTMVLVATAVGATVSWLLVHRPTGLPQRPGASLPRAVRVEAGHTTHALLAMFVFTNLDLLLARVTLGADDVGVYAAGAIVLKIAFWLPQAVAVVLFPSLAEGREGALRLGAAVVAGLGLATTIGVAVLGRVVLPAVLGPTYGDLGGQAWIWGLAGTAEALAYLLLFSRLAAEDRRAVVAVWAAVALLAVTVLTIAHSSPQAVAVAVTVVAALLSLAGVWAQRSGTRPLPG